MKKDIGKFKLINNRIVNEIRNEVHSRNKISIKSNKFSKKVLISKVYFGLFMRGHAIIEIMKKAKK